MSTTMTFQTGTVVWQDLTVSNAEEIQQFYAQVIGWVARPHPMGEYNDFDIIAAGTGEITAGICHARGSNAGIPPQWLIYVAVDDVRESARRCTELGGKILDGPRKLGEGNFCVIQDPAGAVMALFQPQE